jgi:hypothetical protein
MTDINTPNPSELLPTILWPIEDVLLLAATYEIVPPLEDCEALALYGLLNHLHPESEEDERIRYNIHVAEFRDQDNRLPAERKRELVIQQVFKENRLKRTRPDPANVPTS